MNVQTTPCSHPLDLYLTSQSLHSNPFLVELSATFTHEGGAVIRDVPGCYDGEGRWMVRFAPTQEGEWHGLTTSEDPELDGLELVVRGAPNENPRVHGVLGLDPAHPRRFAFADGTPFVPLGFECDWLFALHQKSPEEFAGSMARLAACGFNYLVTNVYAHAGFSPPSEWVLSPPRLYLFGGSNEEPDHATLNVAFFQDFDRMLRHLHAQGTVVHLMFQAQNKHVRWPARRTEEDDLSWRYVVARYQAFGNLVWDLGKESYYVYDETGGWDYLLERMALVRRTDAYHHLVTVHDAARESFAHDTPADAAADFVSDQIHLGDVDRYNREALRRFRRTVKPYLNIEYGYEEGAEPITTYMSWTTRPWQDILLWTYAIYLGGGYPCYYYNNTSWDLVKFTPEPAGWARYAYLREVLDSLDLNAMLPDNDLAERGFCLAEGGRQYLVFLPEGGDTHLDLTGVPSGRALTCEWRDIFTGEHRTGVVEKPGFSTHLSNPLTDASHPCAIVVRPG